MKILELSRQSSDSMGGASGAKQYLLSQDEFVDVVRDHFSFLLDDLGFIIVGNTYYPAHFGNWEVVMRSDNCWIRIENERGGIGIFIRTSSRLLKGPGRELDLHSLIAYLTSGSDTLCSSRDLTCRQQIEMLAKSLQYHYPAIRDSLQDDKLIRTLEGVKEWSHRLYPHLPD